MCGNALFIMILQVLKHNYKKSNTKSGDPFFYSHLNCFLLCQENPGSYFYIISFFNVVILPFVY